MTTPTEIPTTDPLEGVPAEERTRILDTAERAGDNARREARRTGIKATPAIIENAERLAVEAHDAAIAREVAAYRARQPVNSIGTCSVCGYHGPGPGHDCRPHEPWHRDAVYPDCCLRHRTNGPKGGSCGTLAYEGPDATPETLTGEEAEEQLRATWKLSDATIETLLSHCVVPTSFGEPVDNILRAYVRGRNASEGIVERAIRLDREATARARRPDLTPAEEAKIIASAPGQLGPWTPDAWNTCPKCKGPVEKAGGDVDFADGDEARCIECKTVLMVSIAEDGGSCSVYEPESDEPKVPDPLTDADLRDIAERTLGPGPLAGDGELLRRCRAEIVSLRAALTHEQHEHRIKASLYEMALKDIERLEAEIKSLRTHDRGDLL